MKIKSLHAVVTVGIVFTSCLLSACTTWPLTTQASQTVSVSPSSERFSPPTQVFAPTIANDSPGQMWFYPDDAAVVIRNISLWLKRAQPVNVQLPKENQTVTFVDYMGPSQLFFTDQTGSRVTVYPAYYIGHNSHGYHPVLVQGVVAYVRGNEVQYLHDKQLYTWLANDAMWEAQYREEMWAEADKTAIHDAKASGWGMPGLNLFPAIPGINSRDLPMGGPLRPASGKRPLHKTIPGTVESLVDTVGNNRLVTFLEVWNNGHSEHRWSFLVGPGGTILKHTQSGDLPPQDEK